LSGSVGDGLRCARLFRQARQLGDHRFCNLEQILVDDDLEVYESDVLDPGYTACLVPTPDGPGGGILLARGQDFGRRRFSIAHELAHFHIPKHRQLGPMRCAEADFRSRMQDSRPLEWEANEFAAELLMPAKLFRADARTRDICFKSVYELAAQAMYGVSVTAAAWRIIQTTNEPCALVVSDKQQVRWFARSATFPRLLAERGAPVSGRSLAADVIRGAGAREAATEVEWHAWLDLSAAPGCALLESTHEAPSLGQVLSLLWLPNLEADSSDLDDG